MPTRRLPLLATSLLLALPAIAAERRFELVPTIGMRGGAETTGTPRAEADPSVSFGLTFDMDLRPDAWLEALFERQTLEFDADPALFGTGRFDVDVDYLQLGAAYGPPREGARPYVTMAFGLTHLSASGYDSSSTGFSTSLGGGVQAPLGGRVALRFEVRGYATLSDSEVAVACGPGCSVRVGGSGWFQLAGRVGLAFRL